MVVHYPSSSNKLSNSPTTLLLPDGLGNAADKPTQTSSPILDFSDYTDVVGSLDESIEPVISANRDTTIPTYGLVCSVGPAPFNYATSNQVKSILRMLSPPPTVPNLQKNINLQEVEDAIELI